MFEIIVIVEDVTIAPVVVSEVSVLCGAVVVVTDSVKVVTAPVEVDIGAVVNVVVCVSADVAEDVLVLGAVEVT